MKEVIGQSGPQIELPDEVGPLLDGLIGCWRLWDDPANEHYYLTQLAPDVAQRGPDALTHESEKRIAQELQASLSPELWNELPRLIAERREWQALEAKREEEQKAETAREELIQAGRDEERRARKTQLIERIQGLLETDFLSVEDSLQSDPDSALLGEDELSGLKSEFVRRWAAEDLGQELDIDQASAVAATGGDLKITARAGSGKTRTLVTRALFLQKHCGVPPESILLLAFNRRAAKELKERLEECLPPSQIPHVMTFHALAYALVHPQEELVFDDPNSGSLGASREVQEVIDDHLRSDEFQPLIRDLMIAHYREDWARILDGQHDLDMKEFLAHRRSLPDISLNHDYVKSFGEKLIANILFENGVAYRYEQAHDWNGTAYKPDFTLNQEKVIIEYFGITGDPEYDKRSEEKRRYWKRRKAWTLVEIFPTDVCRAGKGAFERDLLGKLKALGVTPRPLSEKEIWERIRQRSVDSFSKAMAIFIGRGRSQFPSRQEFERALDGHAPASESEELFLRVGRSVFGSYLERLEEKGREDFNGLVHRAIAEIKCGAVSFSRGGGQERGDLSRLEHIMIDEFQDFSPMFFGILSAIRGLNPRLQVSCVGDDWQAINAFAGSDLRFFTDFSSYFESPVWRSIQTNYRSPSSVVKVGNALMDGLGSASESARNDEGSVVVADLERFKPSPIEKQVHGYDLVTPALLRLIRSSLDRGQRTVLLSRRNDLPWQLGEAKVARDRGRGLDQSLAHLLSFLPKEDRELISVSTTHRFKGLEEESVIVVDALEGSYPLIHPNWPFLRVFGESPMRIEDEERRLFYVALTRARESLTLVTERGEESPFLRDILRHCDLDSIQWEKLSRVPPLDEGRLEIRVFGKGTFSVKELLKKYGFLWNSEGGYWAKAIPEEGFSLDSLLSQPWKKGSITVEILDGAGKLRYVG